MRIAAIYDIHANLPALEAVLQEIRQANIGLIIAGGDVIMGPMPRETLARLLDFDIPVQFIQGNCEVAVLEQLSGRIPAAVPEQYRHLVRWNAEQLSDYEASIAGWPKTFRLEIPNVRRVLFCHATPRNENEIFTRLTPEDRLLPVFDAAEADVVVCGHTHMQFDRRIGSTRVVNAGSVGMPFGAPGADWALLGPGVELRHTSYDLDEATQRIRTTDYPGAEEFASRHVLHPPSEQEMLDAFTRSER